MHSNLPALEAVLAHPDGAGADETACLGDIVGYGGDPAQCVEIVRSSCRIMVAGNHDRGAAGLEPLSAFNRDGATAAGWTSRILGRSALDLLAELPLTAVMDGFLLCHSFPPDPGSFTYVLHASLARECCSRFPGMVMLTGHTHLPRMWDRTGAAVEDAGGVLPETCVIAAGSTGQPRDADPRAAYLLVDTEARTYRHVRVEYDMDRAAASIRAAGLPDSLWRRLYR